MGKPKPYFEGLVIADTPGRHDCITLSVAAGSYVLPSDIVSAFGDGNTLNGGKRLQEFFFMETGHLPEPELALVCVSGGEYVVRFDRVWAKFRDADTMDAWVCAERLKHIETLRALPPPRQGSE